MKKILVYSVSAVAIGALLTLVPLLVLTGTTVEDHFARPRYLSETLEKLEGAYDLTTPKLLFVRPVVFATSFVAALVVYFLFKRKLRLY